MRSHKGRRTRRGHLREVAATSAVAAGGALLGACSVGGGSPPPAKLQGALELWMWDRYWGPGTVGEAVVREFTQQQPDLKVTFEAPPGSNTKLPTSAAAGVVPDVARMDRFLAAEWGVKGIIQPLNDLVKGSKVLVPNDWRDGLRSDVTWRDKVYAVPQGSTVWVFFWNRKVYQEIGLDPTKAPATWDELKDHSRRLFRAEGDGAIQRYGFAPQVGNGGAQAAWLIFMWQQGQDELSPDRTKATFNTAAGLRAMEQVMEFVTVQGGIQRFNAFRDNLATAVRTTLLPSGHVPAHLDTNSQATVWRQGVPDMSVGMGLIPKPAGGQDTTYQGGPAQVIPAGAKNVPAALRFLEHIQTREAELRFADGHEMVPVSKAACQSEAYLSKAPERKTLVQLALGAKWVPVVPGGQEILTLHSQMINDMLNGAKGPREAVAWGQMEIQKVLDQYVR